MPRVNAILRLRAPVALLIGLAAAGSVTAQSGTAWKSAYVQRYQNKTLFLKVPLPAGTIKVFVSGSRYRLTSEVEGPTIFGVGQQVRITDVDFGSREVRLKFTSLDLRQQAEIRYQFPAPLDERPPGEEFNQVLAKFFTTGLSYTEIESAKREYIEDRYAGFVEAEARTADMPDQGVHEIVTRANPVGKALWRDLQSAGARVEELSGRLAALERDKNAVQTRLNAIQQEKTVLDSAGKDLRERIRLLQTTEAELKKQLARTEGEAQKLERAIRAACTEAGLQSAPATPAAELLDALAGAYMQLSAGNRAYQSRVQEMEAAIARLENTQAELTRNLAAAQAEKQTLARQLEVLATKDKDLAREMFQLQHDKNVIQSKLLSRQVLSFRVNREQQADRRTYRVDVRLKELPLGAVEITAPATLAAGRPQRLTLAAAMRPARELDPRQDPDLALLLKYLKDFPQLAFTLENRTARLELRQIQSPERDNTDLWVWEIVPQAGQDADLVFRFHSTIESEPLPLFDLPLLVPYPTVERTLFEYFQPVPLGIGLAAGLLIALPFFLIHRRRNRRLPPQAPSTPTRRLHFEKKEL